MDDDFIYTMVSNDDDGGSFANIANDVLDFSDGYEVCLQDMLFMPGSWYNVREGSNYLILRNGDGELHEDVTVTIPPGNYYTRDEFVHAFNRKIAEIPLTIMEDNRKIQYFGGKFSLTVPNSQKPDVGTIKWVGLDISRDVSKYKIEKCKVRFSKELAYLVGVTEAMLGLVPWIEDGWSGDVANFDLLKNTLPLIWVFTDFVGTTIIGSLREPLLRMVPIQVGSGILEHSVFSADQYVPVKRKRIQSLRAYIKDSILADQTLKIQGRIVLTLHFRLRQ